MLFCLAGIAIAIDAQAATCLVNAATDDPGDASAKVIAVDSASWGGANPGVVTLRDCIVAANLMTGATGAPTAPGMSITFDASVFTDAGNSTIVLASDLPMLFNNMTIDASAIAVPITIDGGNGLSQGQGHRAFFVSGLPAIPVDELPDPDGAQAITVLLGNLIIQNALAQGGSSYFGGGGMGAGGALFVNKLATVTLEHVEFTTNTASAGDSAVAGGGLSNFGGGGMGAGVQTGGGGGLASVPGHPGISYGSGNGIGTASDDGLGGGFGGDGIGQISDAQGFASPEFNGGAAHGFTDGDGGGIGGGGGASAEDTAAGDGGFGGGGGVATFIATTIPPQPPPYDAGNGGFGGGGGYGDSTIGGNGGFGGGGGGSAGVGGNGGFGGGGAGQGIGGVGGGGNAAFRCAGDRGFGGGAAFGGALFVRNGGTLTVRSSVAAGATTIHGNNLIPSTGIDEGSNPGAAAGRGLFLMTGASMTFDIDGHYALIDDIADESLTSLPGPCYTPGDGAGAALIKSGTGVLELSAADNTYVGTTAINAGVLRLTGGTIKSDSIVAPGAALAGDGFSANVANSGMLAPGTPTDAFGTLTASGGVNFNGGSSLCIHADATGASSHLSVGGNVNLGGIVRFEFASTPPVGTAYTFVMAASAAGAFDGFETSDQSIGGVFGYQLVTTPATVSFTVIASDAVFRDGFDGPTANGELCAAAFAN